MATTLEVALALTELCENAAIAAETACNVADELRAGLPKIRALLAQLSEPADGGVLMGAGFFLPLCEIKTKCRAVERGEISDPHEARAVLSRAREILRRGLQPMKDLGVAIARAEKAFVLGTPLPDVSMAGDRLDGGGASPRTAQEAGARS